MLIDMKDADVVTVGTLRMIMVEVMETFTQRIGKKIDKVGRDSERRDRGLASQISHLAMIKADLPEGEEGVGEPAHV
jgi:hypothetical protein